ncbi:Hypp2784 [Branchiostoma lanceolatum]|uniref:Hypp2784 protein n=1 Tax=Branchiostoma lanceolatum TaxID=7740 RepID=A0A8J9ZX62_BRALA|nr:Hypp2784 [Branchiostoma lanceolatum]
MPTSIASLSALNRGRPSTAPPEARTCSAGVAFSSQRAMIPFYPVLRLFQWRAGKTRVSASCNLNADVHRLAVGAESWSAVPRPRPRPELAAPALLSPPSVR